MVEIHEVPANEGESGSSEGSQSLRQRNAPQQGNQEVGDGTEVQQAESTLTFNEQVDQARAQMQPTPMEKFMAIVKSLILRALVIYFIMSFLRGNTTPNKAPASGGGAGGSESQAANSHVSTNIYPNGTIFDMYVYISDDKDQIRNFTNANLLWKQEGLIYGDWYGGPNSDGTVVQSVKVSLSEALQNNGSTYLHSYIVPNGLSPDPALRHLHSKSESLHTVKMLNKYKRKRYAKTKNLITGETSATIEEQEKAKIMASEIVSHWHPNVTVCFVTDWTGWTAGSVPAPLNEFIQFVPTELKYKPVIFFNDYWNLMKDYQPINQTVKEITLTITYQPISLFKWQIYASQSMRSQWQTNFFAGEEEEDDQDTLKEAILDTNPYLLGLTFIVSILHSIFEFLAFKNDIQFWNNRQSLEGLSVRSVFFSVFQSVIVLLYVLDNDTNFVIRMSVFVGLIIEIWKINKVMNVKVNRENRLLGIFPKLEFSDKGSYVESSTRQYDLLAFRYLSWLLFPLLIGYSIYSLLYVEQKGWYSWVLNMLYGFLLTFGFIMMTPQLFINYKLKSVAHLPWRMLSYKFLNTFIDDIFAFVIKMPTMYRIGCLRDDVIFFIFLYQRYIYRIDPTRINEFGFSAEMLEQKKNEIANANPVDGSNNTLPSSSSEANPAITNGQTTTGSGKKPKTSPKADKKTQ